MKTYLRQLIKNFSKEELGQSMIEYTLIMAFVALASAALFLGIGNNVKGVWTAASSTADAANTAVTK